MGECSGYQRAAAEQGLGRMMPLLYIAGPYSSPDPIHGVEQNVSRASAIALEAWRAGWAVICPHKNTYPFHHCADIPESVWLAGDIAMLVKCDAILMIPGWFHSAGARGEYEFALANGLGVFDYSDIGVPSPAEVLR